MGDQANGLTVAVTGASGYLGGRVVERLLADERVARVLGFDLRPAGITSDRFVWDDVDVRSPALEARFSGVDVVVHLAFIMDPIRDEAEMRDVNVNGSQNVFRCAAKAGVGKIVYTSSATVYGAHPDNDVPLTESSPLRANLDFSYPAHKLEVEYVVKEILADHPDMRFVIFRPAVVFGPNVDNAWSHLLELPFLFKVAGHEPPLQFVHEEDVGAALAFGVLEDLDGPYNLAPDDQVAYEEVRALAGKREVDISEHVAFQAFERLWSAGMSEAPAGMLNYVMYPWVVSPAKLADAGFECRYSSLDALGATLEKTSASLRLGKTRVAKRDLRNGALAGAGAMLALVTWRGLRRQST